MSAAPRPCVPPAPLPISPFAATTQTARQSGGNCEVGKWRTARASCPCFTAKIAVLQRILPYSRVNQPQWCWLAGELPFRVACRYASGRFRPSPPGICAFQAADAAQTVDPRARLVRVEHSSGSRRSRCSDPDESGGTGTKRDSTARRSPPSGQNSVHHGRHVKNMATSDHDEDRQSSRRWAKRSARRPSPGSPCSARPPRSPPPGTGGRRTAGALRPTKTESPARTPAARRNEDCPSRAGSVNLGVGIFAIRSCRKPKGQAQPQMKLPNTAPKPPACPAPRRESRAGR